MNTNTATSPSDDPGKRRLGLAAALFVLGFVVFYGLYVFHHSDFSNDDLRNMIVMRQSGFWSFLLTPIDVHFVPVHRLLTTLVYHLAPMNFGLTVAISATLHLAIIVYLYRLLRLLGVGEASWLVVCCYAASIVPLFGMVWWAHAEHRFPYVFCAVYATFHYVTWLRQGGRWHILACLLAFIVGLGAYEKMVLLPVQMTAFAFFADPGRFVREWRRSLLVPFVLGLLSLSYVVGYLSIAPTSGHASVAFAGRAILEFLKMLGTGIAALPVLGEGNSEAIGWSWRTVLAAALWLALLGFSVARCRRCLWLWLCLLCLLCLDYLPIAISSRIFFFGFVEPHSYRFGFEELYVVAVFVGLVLKETFPDPRSARSLLVRKWAGCLFVVVYATCNVWSLRANAPRSMALQMQAMAHSYMRHLRHDMARLTDPSPGIGYSPMPGYMSVFGIVPDAGSVAQLFNPAARIGLPSQTADYRVDDRGHIQREPVREHGHGADLPSSPVK